MCFTICDDLVLVLDIHLRKMLRAFHELPQTLGISSILYHIGNTPVSQLTLLFAILD